MSLSATSYAYFAACSPGLGAMLQEELRGLGLKKVKLVPGGCEGRALLPGIWRANLGSALALRIWFRMAPFRAAHFGELEAAAKKAPWRAYLAKGTHVKVVAHCSKSRLIHSDAVAERVQKALVAAGMVIDDDRGIRVQVRIHRDSGTLSVDSSGLPLPKRGWRPHPGKAPLSEDLARAALIMAGWKPGMPLLDPMCGAGTIALEAAAWAAGRPAGYMREFAFQEQPHYDDEAYMELRASMLTEPVPTKIFASDRDPGAVAGTRDNAEHGKLSEFVDVAHRTLAETHERSGEFGVERPFLITNPPYGLRMGKEATLVGLYRALGLLAQSWPGATLGAWSSRPDFLRAIEPKLEEVMSTDHGGTRVHFALGKVPG